MTRSVEEQHRELNGLPVLARVLPFPLIAIALVHTMLIGLWVAPSTPLSEDIGEERIRSYVLPWFEQNWSIFAPNPRRVAVTFEIRAQVMDPETGEEITTEWIDLVEGEDAHVHHNPAPARTSKIARRTADRLHTARSRLNDDQLQWLEANYVETPIEQLRQRLNAVDGGATPAQVAAYMRADATATSLATAIAEHAWDGEVVHVQYRTTSRPAVPFERRGEMTIDETAQNDRRYGWRAPAELSEQELEYFERYARQAGVIE
ncbi:DUF5819 family protein [Nesterenkonia alba]|uniref:DUF5819 family protein n=1 Tax=Nesterenkonia alba TaxID=515814 RepID=UPI0003B44DA9|nr:DUF5819 family protein [Nesterenkonia alba]